MAPRFSTAAIALAATLSFGGVPPSAGATMLPHVPRGPIVVTHDGSLVGFVTGKMRAFLGIPYATPPVGALRWRPPGLPAKWHGIRKAWTFGSHCAQNAAGAFGQMSIAEDCLYLNVYTPQNAGPKSRLPVMFWIHGGGLTNGESEDYDPNRLVAPGVVMVTINYRLGLLGFLAQKGLDAENHPLVNYGFMDQQRALGWVKENIAGFGGDPRRVTIFGESAGGLSVLSQLASPGAAGLFSAAIAESGDYQTTLPTLATAEATGDKLADSLGCSNQRASCMRALTVQALLSVTASENIPAIDGKVLTQSLQSAFGHGQFNRVPVMNGSNHDEFRLFTATQFDLGPNGPLKPKQYSGVIALIFGSLWPGVVAQYPLSNYKSPDLAFSALMTDWVFGCQTREANNALSRYVTTYAYEFSDEKAPQDFLPPVSFPYGSAHASELQFIWDEFVHPQPVQLSRAEHVLAQQMVTYWTQFATTGNPDGTGAPHWPHFLWSVGDVNSLVTPEPAVIHDFGKEHQCSFWRKYPPADIACILSGNCQPGKSDKFLVSAER